MKIAHIYGQKVLSSETCPGCHIQAFVIDGKMSCCGFKIIKKDDEAIRFEVDLVGAKRRGPPKKEQMLLLEAQEYCCFYCGISFDDILIERRGRLIANVIHWDHIIPFVFSCQNDGFVASCALCNHRKHDKIFSTIKDARQYLREKHNEDQKTFKARNSVRRVQPRV